MQSPSIHYYSRYTFHSMGLLSGCEYLQVSAILLYHPFFTLQTVTFCHNLHLATSYVNIRSSMNTILYMGHSFHLTSSTKADSTVCCNSMLIIPIYRKPSRATKNKISLGKHASLTFLLGRPVFHTVCQNILRSFRCGHESTNWSLYVYDGPHRIDKRHTVQSQFKICGSGIFERTGFRTPFQYEFYIFHRRQYRHISTRRYNKHPLRQLTIINTGS